MAYTQNPGGPLKQKTGHGIPSAFRQDAGSPVKQMETIKNLYNQGKEFVTDIGDKIYKANEAGQESFDKSIKGDTFWGGSGVKRSYTKNPGEYVKGFVNSLVSDENPKTDEKKKTVTRQMKSPAMQKKKEKSFLDKAGDFVSEKANQIGSAISSANNAGQEAYDKSRKATAYLGDFGGGSGRKDDYTKDPTKYVSAFVSDLMSDNNSKTKEKKKTPATRQMKPKASMAKKKTKASAAKMKKC